MRRRVLTLVLLCSGAAACWACSLNPQPLPPDTSDAAFDSSMAFGPEAGGGVDSGTTNADSSPPPTGDDAAVDGSDASDASSDASDSSDDARDTGDSDGMSDGGDG